MNSTPQTIFKYEAFTLRALRNLKRHSIYFGSPRGFNDPYDCAIAAPVADPTPAQLKAVRDAYASDLGIPASLREQLRNAPIEVLQDQFLGGAQKAVDHIREEFLSNHGVSCFSETNDNLLMWSHYGGQFKGLCLEFRTSHEPFNRLRKVIYTETMPRLNMYEILANPESDEMLDLFCTKAKSWEYEREWRAFHAEAGVSFAYEPAALKGIYFGPEIERQDLDMVCAIMMAQNPNVELYSGVRSTEHFKVEFSLFEYETLASAQARGAV